MEQLDREKRLIDTEVAALKKQDPHVVGIKVTGLGGNPYYYQEVVLSDYTPLTEKKQEESGVSVRYRNVALDSYTPKSIGQTELYATLLKYAKLFQDGKMYRKDPNGIYLCGKIGTGKTHIISALTNTLLASGYECRKTTPIEMMRQIRIGEHEHAPLNRALEKYKTCDFLIIDDFGKDKPTEYSTKTMFEIINYRSDNILPVLITSNYTIREIPKRMTPEGVDMTLGTSIADRLFQGCRLMELSGPSLRVGREAIA